MARLALAGALATATLLIAGTGLAIEQRSRGWLLRSQEPVLEKFSSADEFTDYLTSLERRRRRDDEMVQFEVQSPALPSIEAASPPAQGEQPSPEITNNQTLGVDEGGIVKQVGRFLVVLQDGRLFSADLGAAAGAPLRLGDRLDVYRSPAQAASWYDEMLVLGDRILVTAYNYDEQASEITVVRIDPEGRMRREGRFLLSSSDYYSTDNYATRLVGDQLVFYAPQSLARPNEGEYRFPQLRRADADGSADGGQALIEATDVYAPPGEVDWPVLHTISVCPLRHAVDCRTTAFIGPPMRELYVSPTDVFLWIGAPDGLPWSIDYGNRRRQSCAPDEEWNDGNAEQALVYRVPLDGGAAGAVAVEGLPADQFAFDSRDGRFRALLARSRAGCVKAGAEQRLALLDIPLAAFGARIGQVADAAYAPLPAIESGELENRFVGQWLIYGGRQGWSSMPEGDNAIAASLVAVPLSRPSGALRLQLPHNAIRIERAGSDAIVTGYRDRSGLSLSYVHLGERPRLAATTLLRRRYESEGRSHAFGAWVRSDGSGVIGLPTSEREWRAVRGWSDSESSELSFVTIARDKNLAPAGELGLRRVAASRGYDCEVSCVDWYGNSRPIFTGGRIFALMGTELVEGSLENGRIRELGRLDLTGAIPPR